MPPNMYDSEFRRSQDHQCPAICMIGNVKGVRNLPPTPKGKDSKNIHYPRSKGSTMPHMHQHQGQSFNQSGSSTSFTPHMYCPHPPLMYPPPPPTPPVWGVHHGKGWGDVAEKGWSEDHPVPAGVLHEEVHDDHDDKAWGDSKRRFNEPKNERGGGCKKRRVEIEKDDRGGEVNKCRSKEEQHDRDVPHKPHNTGGTVNIFSIGINQTLDPRRSIKWGLEKFCPDVLPVRQIEDVSKCGQDKAVSGWHCGENLNTLCAASTCSRFDEFGKALPQKLHRHFRDNSAPYTLVIACRNGRHKSIS